MTLAPDENFTELVSDRIRLRRFMLTDLETFVAYRSDPDVARYQGWDAPYPRADGERLISGLLGEHPGDGAVRRAQCGIRCRHQAARHAP